LINIFKRYIFCIALFYFHGGFIKGIVCRVESKDFYIYNLHNFDLVRCTLKGKFKKEFNLKKDKLFKTNIAAVGDFITYDLNDDGSGVITKIQERDNYLSRKAPKIKGASYRGERLEQIIAANIDYLFVISSVREPRFNNKVIDRLIVSAESSHISVILIINKSDLDQDSSVDFWIELYREIGYITIKTSIINGEGIQQVKDLLPGKKSLFWGQSGVGKSSILNKIFSQLDLNVGEISSYTDKGKHTTVTTNMVKVEENTFIIDSPGIREIDPFGIKKEDLGHYFLDFTDYIYNCRFNTCTHNHEPGCAVVEAVNNGEISEYRYDSYLRILETIEEDIIF
jgi:ribosome biogenesis GTPase / thiamine phosphate phosphatase